MRGQWSRRNPLYWIAWAVLFPVLLLLWLCTGG